MTKILFCTSGYFPDLSGGAEHQARLQAEELVRRGHSVRVVCPRRRGVVAKKVSGIRVYRIPVIERKYWLELSYCFLLTFFLLWNIRRFQLIHIHMTHLDAVVICAIAWLFRKPVYAKIARGGHGGDARYLARRWYLRRTALAYPARFQAISEEIASDLRGLGVAAHRIVNIPNGVDLAGTHALTPAGRREIRARLGLPTEKVLVLFLGRFVPMKGLDTLLEAWAEMPPTDANLVLVGRRRWDRGMVVPGPDPTRDAVDRPDVIVRDWTDEPGAYMAAADIFVLPSRGEGMSNALLRAMSEGIAVIASRVGAAREMIEDGVSGCLVPSADPAALRDAMSRLISDANTRAEMGAAARVSTAGRYSIESVVDRIEAEYRAIL